MDEVWSFEHSVDCPVTKTFAWQFWTTVNNWKLDADVESVELDGPFEAGSRGATVTRSSGRIEWVLVDVEPETTAAFDISVPGAVVRFRWKFEDLGNTTRMIQRVTLSGENAHAIIPMMAGLESGIPEGMKKLAETMAGAAASTA